MNSHHRKARIGHDRWLVSYADFITLMFAFFVVLYAFANANQQKQIAVAEAINSAFRSMGVFPLAAERATQGKGGGSSAGGAGGLGVEQPALPMNIVMGEDVLAPAQVKQDLNRIRGQLTQTLSNQVATHTVSMYMGRDGLVISLREAGFFDSGSATPKPQALPALRRIAATLGQTGYDVRIEGHTDNIPIHDGRFSSNWELSTARATGIARLFLEMKAISPDRLSAAGYAQYHPVASNDTAEGRSQNRRVDLVVLPRTKINFAAPNPVPGSGQWHKITDYHPASQPVGESASQR